MTLFFRIALAVLTMLCINHAHADRQEELETLRQRISTLQREMEKTSDSKSDAEEALRESERAISASNRILYKLAKQQREASHALGQLQQQSRQISLDMQEQQLQLSKLLYQQYLGGKQEYFILLLNNHDPNQAARELQYYDYIAKSRATWLKSMRGNLRKLNTVTAQAQQQSKSLLELQTDHTARQQILLKQKNTHQQLLKKIALQLKQQNKEIGRLQRDENHLAKLVEKLARLVAQPKTTPSQKNTDTVTASPPYSEPFISLKGKLTLPVTGKIINKFGQRRPDNTVLWKGLFVKSAAGQPVNAVAPGRVIFSDWLRGFGNLLIIDHGGDYMSLYGNNETLYKQVGDELRRGEMIAAVGSSGGNDNYGLYFELRHEGIPMDPAKWLK